MRYSFGDFILDAQTGELLRSGEVVALRSQTFRLLQLLIERAPALLSRDTLLDEVWGRTALAPNAVPQAISELRRALGDDAQSPNYIETRHRRGYRFLATVQIEDSARAENPAIRSIEPAAATALFSPSAPPQRVYAMPARRWVWSAALLSILLIAGWGIPHYFRVADTGQATTQTLRASALVLAELPADEGVPSWIAPAALELFGQHLADSRLRLLRSDALGLSDSTQGVRWQHQAHDLLAADHAVGGRWHVDKNGKLILDLSLIDLADGHVVASRRMEGEIENLAALICDASSVIAAALRVAPLDDTANQQTIAAQDGADYGSALSELNAGQAEAAAVTFAALHARIGKPQWMEAALIKAYVQAGDRQSATALLDARLARTQTLPLGERLRVQAELATLRYQPVNAAAAYRAFVDLYPEDVESRIDLVESEIDGLQGESARKSLAQLAALPASRNDPRLTLLRARIARLDNDFATAAGAAAAALQTARQHDLPKLAASAALAQAMALDGQGELDQAARLLAEFDSTWSARMDSGALLDLRLSRVQLLREQGHLADAALILEQLQSSYTAELPRARIGIEAALLHTESGQPGNADVTLQRIKPAIDRSGDPDLAIGWLNADALNAIARNDVDYAQQAFAKAFTLARSNGLAGRHVGLQVNAGLALMRWKRVSEAEQQWQQALETFEALGDRRGQATCLGNLAASASSQGQLERSVELNTRALALFRELHLSGPQARTAYNLALGAERDGKLKQARDYYKEAGDAWAADGQKDLALRAAVGQSDIALLTGDAEAAKRITDAETRAEETSPLSQSHLLAMQSRIAFNQGNLAESRHLQERALLLRKQDGNEGWIALSELELLRNDLFAGGDATRVQIAAESLVKRFSALHEARDEARAWLLVADAQLTRKKIEEARRSLDKVKAVSEKFSDLTVAFDLEWAEAWASDAEERALRLRALQKRAGEQGYVLQKNRAERAIAVSDSSITTLNAGGTPLPPYVRATQSAAF